MSGNFIKVLFLGFFFLLIQIVFLQHLVLFGAVADIMFIYGIWVILHHERYKALFIIFILAFFQDMLLDFWGVNMISKVLFAYIAHKFIYSFKESNLLGGQILLLLLGTSALYTLIYLGVAEFAGRFAVSGNFAVLWVTGSLYTAMVGFVTYLLKSK